MPPDLIPPTPQPPRFDYPTLAPKATVFGSSESIGSHVIKNSRRKWLLWLGISGLLLAIIAILLVVIFRQPGVRLNSNANDPYSNGINVSIGDINGNENDINISIGNSGNSVNNTDGATTSGQTLHLQTADSTHSGLLTATDWNTFNAKQPAGFYLTHETDPAWSAAAVSYFNLTQNEIITGIPAFNGGNSGLLAPFSVNSTFLVTNLNADLLDGLQAIDFAPAGGSGNYIQNQTLAQQTADFWIAGRGQADTGLLTPELDVASAGILSLGTATATALSLGQAGITTTNAGALIISQLLTGSLGANVTGATVSLNASSNFDTNINTGTSTGTITIGGGSGTLAVDTTSWDISSAGVISGATGITSSGNITFSALTANRLVTTTAGGQLTDTIASANVAASVTDETGSGALVFGTSPSVSTLTVSSGGINVTGNSTITGTLASLTGLTSSGNITFSGLNTAGIVTNTAGGVLGTILLVPLANGGTNANLTASNGGVVWSNATQMQILAGTATANQCLLSGSNATPSWGTCAGSGTTFFTLAGTTGTPQSINGGDTATLAQGTNITTVAGATDTITISVINNPTFVGLVTGQLGLSVTGATVSLNASSNFDTNINTGTSTGAVTIGGGLGTFALDSTAFDVTTAGALSGITTISTSSTINSQTISNAASFTGTVNAVTGYKVNGAATSGNVLRGDGTNFVSATLGGGDITGAALTDVDDTNVTLTLTGSPTNALLRATGLTLGWAGQLSVARGGTGASSLNDLITLATHTTGDYVATITGSGTITSTGATSGENIAHTLSVTVDSIGDTQLAYNTGQHLTTASSPSFAGLTLTGALGMGANTITSGLINGQTISSTANFTGTVVAATSLSTPQLISTVATGTAPLSVTSTTLVTNLNADLLDGHDATYFQIAGPYLTVESDTLATVTGRGATTSTDSSFTGGLTVNNLTMADATNIILNTTTGTKIGTATNQKLGFYNATPIVQPSGNALTALSNLGLVATPTLTSSDVGLGNVTNNAQLVSGNSTQNGYFGDIYLYDDSTPSHYLQITNSANLTAAHVLSLDVNDANRSISISGDLSLAGSLTTSGAYASTFTMTNTTTITFPTTGTLATTAQLHTQNTDTGTNGTNFTIGDGTTTLIVDTSATDDTINIEQGTYDSIMSFTAPGAATQTYTFATGGTVCTTGSVCTSYQPSGPYLTVETDPIWVAAASSYFNLSDSETITGIPVFNGGTTGFTSPFSVDSTYLVTNLNADLLDGYDTSMTAGNNTVVVRNASGYVLANYFNTTADVTANTASHFAIQTGSDNYIRWQTPADARTSLGVVAAGAGDIWVEKAGDSMSGNLTMSGSTANIILGSNYLSGDGGDEGVFVDSAGSVGIGTTGPTTKLEVSATGNLGTDPTAASSRLLQLTNSGTDVVNETWGIGFNTESYGGNYLGAYISAIGHYSDNANTSLVFGTRDLTGSATERMRIDSTGNVGIGTTSPGYKLKVEADGGGTGNGIYINIGSYNDGLLIHNMWDNNDKAFLGQMDLSSYGGLLLYKTSGGVADKTVQISSGSDTYFNGGNVGIGTTTPGASLDISPTTASYFTAGLKVQRIGVPSQYVTLNQNLGVANLTTVNTTGAGAYTYFNRSDNGTSITTSMIIDNSGNVGIGTESPGYKLEVNGTAKAVTLTDGYITINAAQINRTGGAVELQYGLSSAGQDVKMFGATVNEIVFKADTGRVGIGTTSPAAKLEVRTGTGEIIRTAFSADGTFYHSILGGYSVTPADSYLALKVNNGTANTQTEIMRLVGNGNVGIGTTTPAVKLELSTNSASNVELLRLTNTPDAPGNGSSIGFYQAGSRENYIKSYYANVNWNLGFGNGSSDLMTLQGNSGNVGIGTTSPGTTLDVNGIVNAATGYRIANAATSGYYFRGNGTNFVSSGIQAGDVPTLNQNTTGWAGTLRYEDNRTISPSELGANLMKFGFTSYTNNSSYPWADFLHFRSYQDASGGDDNLLVLNRAGLGMRLYQQTYGSATAYSAYKDLVLAENSPTANYLTKYSGTGTNVSVTNSSIFDNGNVGIGTTSPTAPLSVYRTGTYGIGSMVTTNNNAADWNLNSQLLISGAAGSNGLALGVSGTPNDRISFIQSGHPDTAYASNLGTLALNPFGGNVGIGTTSPGGKLDILGDNNQLRLTQSVGGGWSSIYSDNAAGTNIGALLWSTSEAWLESRTGDLVFGAGGAMTEKMRIKSGGNVGIGTASPDTLLDVRIDPATTNTVVKVLQLVRTTTGTAANGMGAQLQFVLEDAGGNGIYSGAIATTWEDASAANRYARMDFYKSKSNSQAIAMSIDKDGNVGIGTTNPVTNLHIQGSTAWDSTTGLNLINGSADYGRAILRITGRLQGGNDAWAAPGLGRATMIFASNANASGVGIGSVGTDKFALQYEQVSDKLGIMSSTGGSTPLMVWQQNGNVGIGTTSPSEKLEVYGTGLNTQHIRLNTNGANNAYTVYNSTENNWITGLSHDIGVGAYIIHDGTSGGTRLLIDNTGNVGIGTTTPQATLDVNGTILGKLKQLTADYTVDSGSSAISVGDLVAYINGKAKKPSGAFIAPGNVTTLNGVASTYISAAALDSTHFVTAYRNASTGYVNAVVSTVSGTTITPGTPTALNAVASGYISVAALDSTHFVTAYQNGSSSQPDAVVSTVTGTTITPGTPTYLNGVYGIDISVAALDSTHFVTAYNQSSGWYYFSAVVSTVSSGTTITPGTPVIVSNCSVYSSISVAALNSTHFVTAYNNSGSTTYVNAVVSTVSGTTITPGTPAALNAVASTYISVAALDSTHFVTAYKDGIATYVNVVAGTVSGTTITPGNPTALNAVASTYISAAVLDSTHFVTAYRNESTTYVNAVVSNVNYTNLLGMATNSASANGTVTVASNGIVTGLTGLTAGSTYYWSYATGLTTVAQTYKVGLAISTSSMLLNSGSGAASDQFFGDMIFANNFVITEASGYPQGLIFKNQLGSDILSLNELGDLMVPGNLKVTGNGIFDGNVGIGNAAPGYLLHVGSASVASGIAVARFENAGGTCTITPSTSGGVTCTSDERLKKDITTYDDALSQILGLKTVSYHMLAETETDQLHVGFIAQEYEKLFPDLVYTDSEGIKSISYAGLTPYLAKAIQQQQQTISELNNKVASLSTNLQYSSTLNLTTITGNLAVKGNTTVADITVNGHIISAGETPVITAGLAAGNNAVTAVLGNDTSGTITITTGTNTSADSLVEVVFKQPFGKQPKVILTPNNSDTAKLEYYYNSFTNKFGIYLNQSPTTNTEYKFSYFVIE